MSRDVSQTLKASHLLSFSSLVFSLQLAYDERGVLEISEQKVP